MGLCPCYLSAGRSDAQELASMCTAGCDAAGGHLSFGEDGLDRVVHVRESTAQGRDKHLEPLKTARPPRWNWGVFDIVGGKQLVYQLKVAAVEHLLRDAPESCLVLFRRHRVSSRRHRTSPKVPGPSANHAPQPAGCDDEHVHSQRCQIEKPVVVKSEEYRTEQAD